jgi:hypothetical protein
MPVNFPNSPSDGQSLINNGKTYTYNSAKTSWKLNAPGFDSGQVVSILNQNAVDSAVVNSVLSASSDNFDSSQVISLVSTNSNKTNTVADMAALVALTGMSTGDQALVTATNKLFMYNGAGWYLIATIANESPSAISGVDSNYAFTSGTAIVVNAIATDPEGLPLTWSSSTSGLTNEATITQGTGDSSNYFTVTPSTNTSHAGTFTLTIAATDGVNGAVNWPIGFTLVFYPDWSASSHTQFIEAPQAGTTDHFGWSVGVSDDDNTVIVGAPYEDAQAANSGAAYIIAGGGSSTTLYGASYDSVTSQVLNGDVTIGNFPGDTSTTSILFNANGTKLYLTGYSTDTVYQFSLSTAYDITASSLSYDDVSFNINGGGVLASAPFSMKWNNDGTKLFVLNMNSKVFEYVLSTAYDVSTMSYNNVVFSTASEDSSIRGFGFSNDGTKMFLGGGSNPEKIYMYNLSSAWDLSTASYSNTSYTYPISGAPGDIIFNSNGSKMFVMTYSVGIREFELSTPYDITTVGTYSQTLSTGPQESQAYSFTFNGDMSKIYLIGAANEKIFQYSTGGAQPFLVQQRIYLNSSDVNNYAGTGVTISGDGNTAAVGIPNRKHASYDTPGSVLVWTKSGTTWSQQTEIFASDATNSHKFGESVSLSEDGNTLAIGASVGDRVYIYTRSGSTWTEQKKIVDGVDHTVSHSVSNGGYYGQSVDLTSDGNNLVIGAPSRSDSGSGQGSAYVYTRSGTTWSYQATIVPSSRGSRDGFGWSVSIARGDGNTIAIGQKYSNATYAGYAWIFTRSGTTWSEESNFRHSTSVNADNFGRSLALNSDGNFLLVGAPDDQGVDGSGNNKNSGRAFVFKRTSGTWAVTKIIEPSAFNNNTGWFGEACALSLDGSSAVIGNTRWGNNNNYSQGKGAIDIYNAPLS